MPLNKSKFQRALSFILYIAMACALAFIIIGRHSSTLELGAQAPILEQITMLEGKRLPLKSLLIRPMVINFWASWCPPCQKEMPVMSKLAKLYKNKVTFVGVAVDSPVYDVKAIKKQFDITYALGSMSQESMQKWQAQILPTTYIIDKYGKILWAKSGYTSEDKLATAIQMALTKK